MVDLHSSRPCPNNHNNNSKTVLIITLRLHLVSFYSIAFFANESAGNKVLIEVISKIKLQQNVFVSRKVVYDSSIIQATLCFKKCQKPVNHWTTEGSCVEFIGYRILQHEATSQIRNKLFALYFLRPKILFFSEIFRLKTGTGPKNFGVGMV